MHPAILGLLSLILSQAPADQPSIVGRWVNPDHTVIVDIAQCETDLCGTVQWATQQAQQDARRGTAQLIGLEILTDLREEGDVWKGHLFIPDADMHAEAKLEAQGDELKVSGCELGFCKSQLWARAEGPLPESD